MAAHRPYTLLVFSNKSIKSYDDFGNVVFRNVFLKKLTYCRADLGYMARYLNYRYPDWWYFNVYNRFNGGFVQRVYRTNI